MIKKSSYKYLKEVISVIGIIRISHVMNRSQLHVIVGLCRRLHVVVDMDGQGFFYRGRKSSGECAMISQPPECPRLPTMSTDPHAATNVEVKWTPD